MSAVVEPDGTVRQLDRRPEPDENVTEQSVTSPGLLAKFLLRLFREVSRLKRRWAPKYLDFRGIVSGGTAMTPALVSLDHNFGAPVVWWIVRVQGLGTGSLKFAEELDTSTDNRLELSVNFEATLTIRVQEAG